MTLPVRRSEPYWCERRGKPVGSDSLRQQPVDLRGPVSLNDGVAPTSLSEGLSLPSGPLFRVIFPVIEKDLFVIGSHVGIVDDDAGVTIAQNALA